MPRESLDSLISRFSAALARHYAEIRARADPYIEQARARYEKLEPRERLLVQVAVVLIAVFLGYNLIYSPIVDLSSGLNDKIAARERDLVSVRRLSAEYIALKQDLAHAEHRTVPDSRDFSLFSVVESTFSKSVGHDKIASITPAEDKRLPGGLVQHSVQLKLQNVNLQQIVDALYAVRMLSVPVGIGSLRIERRTQDTHSYDVDLVCIALARNG